MIEKRLVPFEMKHLGMIDLREIDRVMIEHWGWGYFNRSLPATIDHPGAAVYTCFVDDEPFFIGGLVMRWPGVGEFWGLGSRDIDRRPKLFIKLTKTILEQLITHYSLHRAEAHCWAGYPHGLKWLQKLGFKIEGLRSSWSPNKHDYYQLARLI